MYVIIHCARCFQPFERGPKNHRYCSGDCYKAHLQELNGVVDVNLSNGTLGAVKELLVSVDLLSKGFSVFRSVSPASPFDLVAILKDKILKVEVTSGTISTRGRLSYPKHEKNREHFNQLAIVLSNKTIIYIPELIT